MYKRRKLCNIIDDLYILGYCIVHNTKDKRLTKVFKGTTCTSLDVTVHGEDSVVSNGAAIDEPLYGWPFKPHLAVLCDGMKTSRRNVKS